MGRRGRRLLALSMHDSPSCLGCVTTGSLLRASLIWLTTACVLAASSRCLARMASSSA